MISTNYKKMVDYLRFISYTICVDFRNGGNDMKSTGIVRKVDELGRIVLPIELRRTLDIAERDPLEIYTEGNDTIILKKYQPTCIFCDSLADSVEFGGYNVCTDCIEKLYNMKDKAE